ncbi:uncharacterized protein DSM5745_01395 [Aspergillus mulundensis]|uniref:Xylanolytic transcriptional activator regulatory domain-containing protein n=1 Tax=Aspergillus mulundensis TaxID=1810919 RepID=A0A3D8T696_9EURO|nr:hypothetical protein DSM5745_01395 [Aspergillus mulundensis]RDW94073.1 hypothetical protein DSM5745_01395 [Aspergillus mulundensis]
MDSNNEVEPPKATILVDLGGVFVHPPEDYTLTTSESTVTLGRVLSSSIWMEYEMGKITEQECFTQVADLYGFQVKDLEAVVSDLRESLTYDQQMLSVFHAIKRRTTAVEIILVTNISEPEYRALRNRWDEDFWRTFDGVYASWMIGLRKPSLRFYRHVVRSTRSLPQRTFVIDDRPENVLAALSLGLRGTVNTDAGVVFRELLNFIEDPVKRGLTFLRQNAGKLHSTTQEGDSIEENYAQLLVLEALQDWSLVDLRRPPCLWNFFSGKPKYTSQTYPDDMDTTALALVAIDYKPEIAHQILDKMLGNVNEDGLAQVYFDKSRPRVDAIIALNVLVALHKYGRGYELPETLDWVHHILLNRAYIYGTRYYASPEWFLYYASRLLLHSKDPSLEEKLGALLRARLVERTGVDGDAFCLAMRLLACNSLGIRNHLDRERLASMQQEDGGWEPSAMYVFPTDKKTVGNRGTTTALAVKALQDAIKCDGEDPCHNCQSREQICEFQDSNDNASTSRRYAASFEERCQHMDNLCERLEGLAKTLSDCIATAQRSTSIQSSGAASISNSIPPARHEEQTALPHSDPVIDIPDIGEVPDRSPGFGLGAVSESSGNMQGHDTQTYPTPVDAVGHMVADSYGRLRYIGGATNKMMIEAVQNLSPGGASKPIRSIDKNNEISLPFFIQGQVWPELPYLPQPQDLARPPQYVSDLLVGIYFDQLHYTFPILYKPDFMRRYHLMNAGARTSAKRDTAVGRGFLSVFFAVCACASSLLPRAPGSSSLPGIEYYQKALLLHFASSGEVFLEQVQCLGLLALCSAGWNTLSQSWRFAGQAVRLAQDLGLHVSSLKGLSIDTPSPTEYVEAQVARCTWWSVFTLDCLMSICLGRPMATDEADCCCDLPFDISNEDLEHGIPPAPSINSHLSSTSSPMTGFLALTRLCRIAARVHRFYSSNRIRGRDSTLSDDWTHLLPTLDGFVRELDEWLQKLPNEIRFSANLTQSGPNLTMCVIVFILHSGTIMNLYRFVLPCLNLRYASPTNHIYGWIQTPCSPLLPNYNVPFVSPPHPLPNPCKPLCRMHQRRPQLHPGRRTDPRASPAVTLPGLLRAISHHIRYLAPQHDGGREITGLASGRKECIDVPG